MKLERLIIGLLIIALLWLAFNRVPKYKGTDIRYITKYEQIIDTLLKDTIVSFNNVSILCSYFVIYLISVPLYLGTLLKANQIKAIISSPIINLSIFIS